MQREIVWLIGASSGIGLELAKHYLSLGYTLIASARVTQKAKELQTLKEQYKEKLTLVDIDVREGVSVSQAVQKAWSSYGGVDVCIYNAGVYEKMSVAEWNMEHFEMMNDVNYLGAIRLLTAITPLFEEQKSGHIVFNASVSSYFGLPYGGGYSAPKAALLNFCESIKPELDEKNINLQVINHGFVKTRLTQKNDFEMPQLLEPQEAARKIYEGVEDAKVFEIRFPWALTRFLHLLRSMPYAFAFAFTKKAL